MSAIEDAERMAPWIEQNQHAMQGDPQWGEDAVSMAVLDALSGPVDPDMAMGVPLLRFVGERPALALLAALLEAPVVGYHHGDTCSRCTQPLPRQRWAYPLWMPAGSSVVELVFCGHCHDVLNDYAAMDLHWQDRVAVR